MSDRQWRRSLTKPGKRTTPVEAPRQVVYDDDGRLTDDRDPNAHTHGSSDITDGSATFVTVAQFQAWLITLLDANPDPDVKLVVPDYPPP